MQTVAMSVAEFAEVFQLVALVMFIFVIPHSIACLFAYESHDPLRYAKRHKDSGYWWSITTWEWYVKVSTGGLLLLFTLYFIRVFNKYEVVIQDLPPQPDWSYFLSMGTTEILLVILWLPSFFYLYIKHEIRHDPRIRRLVNEENERDFGHP
jgi:hypothetical protein